MMRSESEINRVLDGIDPDAVIGGTSQWPGMTYEQGVEAALSWAVGRNDDDPMED